MIGPWSKNDVDVHKEVAKSFNALYPNVTFDFKLFNWTTGAAEVTTLAARPATTTSTTSVKAAYFLWAEQPAASRT